MNKKTAKKILKKINQNAKSFDDLSEKERFLFNKKRQKIVGKKKYDYFEITEPGCCDKDIFSYENIKDWDFDNYQFQKEHKTMVRENYDQLYMSGDWFRAMPLNDFGKRDFMYGMIESARSYLTNSIYERISDEIEKNYPCIYVSPYGQKLFKKIPGSKNYSMVEHEKRCCGREKEREELEKRLREVYQEIDNAVVEALKPFENMTFIKNDNESGFDAMDIYLIGGIPAAEQISFKTFFKDFTELRQPFECLLKVENIIFRKYKKIVIKTPKKGEKKELNTNSKL